MRVGSEACGVWIEVCRVAGAETPAAGFPQCLAVCFLMLPEMKVLAFSLW